MVDHRADHREGFDIFGTAGDEQAGWPRATLGERLSDWFAARPRLFRPGGMSRLVGAYRLPVYMSLAWLALVAAYAIGYYGNLSEAAAARPAAALDLLFFLIAASGPLAVLWVSAIMVRRVALLADAIAGQSETALALATTVANLHDSVDDLSDTAAARMDASLRALENKVAGNIGALDEAVRVALEETQSALADRGAELDRMLADVRARTEDQLGQRIEGIDARLSEGTEKLAGLTERQNDEIVRRLEESAAKVEGKLAESARALGDRLLAADRQVSEGIDRRADELAQSMQAVQEAQAARLDEAAGRMEQVITTMQKRISRALEARAGQIDRTLAEESARLGEAMQATAAVVDGDLRRMLDDLRRSLDETGRTLSANPPATAEELTDLLGASAAGMVAPERAALSESVARIERLEGAARKLIARIDRTARLAIPREGAPVPLTLTRDAELFDDLPPAKVPLALSWDAVISAMDLQDTDAEQALEEARRLVTADPVAARLLDQAAVLAERVELEGLFLEDLVPEPAPPALWAAFARGGSLDFRPLDGIRDEVAGGILRNLMRRDAGFRELALRFATDYAVLLGRAVEELGPSPVLVEMADSRSGRIFQLVGRAQGMFRSGNLRVPG